VLLNAVRRTAAIRTISALAILSLAACSDNALSPLDGSLFESVNGKTAGPSGLEQRLTAKVEEASIGSPYNATVTVTSTIVNTGTTGVAVTTRECLVQAADVGITAQADRFEPFISCSAVSSSRTLAPGESSSQLQVQFGIKSGPGNYTVKLRHALSPEFRGEVSFRIQ
jgi:hypothetical protein